MQARARRHRLAERIEAHGQTRLRFSKKKLTIFVDGCFWHGCSKHGTKSKSNAAFWRKKIAANQARDHLVTRTLRAMGWRVLRIWEHELKRKNERRLLSRLNRATDFGSQRTPSAVHRGH
ncbi:MAG: very short patch repair endonuclease [Opitutus sp.]|nr:very short patch repair endonuclease [Opitutus sp.]